ncbi:MAG: hypothetical protein KKG33_09860 [candidate division Zixibacteria bacterium]|nr:hypothetical protein [candidate division Zixibacteria bacterium]MBU1471156.1 hypothetical protein [candidate division Zixibacteria bacterium]MBU2625853.1 hypothetical protein [candidate division Zixibacteria bacterium]
MKIGYCGEGNADEAFLKGLAHRLCPDAELERGSFRGTALVSERQQFKKTLKVLCDIKCCKYVVMLKDCDKGKWREVKKQFSIHIDSEYEHMVVIGIADRNLECWLALDRPALAAELGCQESEIPVNNPSSFVKSRFGVRSRCRIEEFVKSSAPLKNWVQKGDSFKDFWEQIRDFGKPEDCGIVARMDSD